MIVYFDTSALVPLLVEESSTSLCGDLWDSADEVVTTRLTYVESSAALAMGLRLGRITGRDHNGARRRLSDLWQEIAVVELDEELMGSAGDAARAHGLRGYDAVHFAAALSVDADDLVAASGDRDLLRAWRHASLAVANTHGDS